MIVRYVAICVLEISTTVTADIEDSASSVSSTASISSTAGIGSKSTASFSASPTVNADFMTSSSINTLATPPSTDARQEQNDDDGSDVGGIVAGCVVAFIVFAAIVICLIIFLIWYHTKKRGEYGTKSGITMKCW